MNSALNRTEDRRAEARTSLKDSKCWAASPGVFRPARILVMRTLSSRLRSCLGVLDCHGGPKRLPK